MDGSNTPHLLIRQSKRAQTDGPLPTSDWQKTGVPIIIGLVLFFLVFCVLFYIVRQRRKRTRKEEKLAADKIDLDDVEDRAVFQAQTRR